MLKILYFQTPSPWGLELQHMNLEGTQTFKSQQLLFAEWAGTESPLIILFIPFLSSLTSTANCLQIYEWLSCGIKFWKNATEV